MAFPILVWLRRTQLQEWMLRRRRMQVVPTNISDLLNQTRADLKTYGYGSKLGTPKLWMVNTKLDISICGPISVFHFDPHPYGTNHHWGIFQPCLMTPKLGWLSYDTVTFRTPETNGSPGTADPTKRVCLEMAKLLGIINIHIS